MYLRRVSASSARFAKAKKDLFPDISQNSSSESLRWSSASSARFARLQGNQGRVTATDVSQKPGYVYLRRVSASSARFAKAKKDLFPDISQNSSSESLRWSSASSARFAGSGMGGAGVEPATLGL